jgi:type II secretory pathway pseudopilin PulG
MSKILGSEQSFTLVELLIVIGILAILAVVVVLVLNPVELLKQARDSVRLSDLGTLNSSLGVYQAQGYTSLGTSSVVYVSIPDSSTTCANLGLPSLPSGWSYNCVASSTLKDVDGTGWVPVNFTSVYGGSLMGTLPIDPINTTSTSEYYTYVVGGSWKLTSLFESEKYAKKMYADGGTDPALFEIGNDLNLQNTGRGLVGYWKFEEGSGSTTSDSSGNSNTGILTNGPTWTTGKVGNYALSFDGVDDYVSTGNTNIPSGASSPVTIVAWFNATSFPGSRPALLVMEMMRTRYILGFICV